MEYNGTWHFATVRLRATKFSSPLKLLAYPSIKRISDSKPATDPKQFRKKHKHKYEAPSSDRTGREFSSSASRSNATRSSKDKLIGDSKYTGGSTMCSSRILLSSSTETGRHDLSSNGRWVIIRNFCSNRVCSDPSNDPISSASHDTLMPWEPDK